MAGVTVADPSIYNNVWKPDPQAGVDLQSKYLAIRQASQQNQLTQQALDFRQGISEAQANASNPDGTQDTGKFNKLIMNDPRTAWKAEELLQSGNNLNNPTSYTGTDEQGNPIAKAIPAQFFRGLPGNPGTQPNALSGPSLGSSTMSSNNRTISPSSSDVQAAHDKIDSLQDAASGLANDPNPTRPTAISVFSDAISKGHLTSQEAIQVMTDPNDPMPNDPNEIKNWAARHAKQLGAAKQVLTKVAPLQNSTITPNSPTPQVSPTFAQGMHAPVDLNDIVQNEKQRQDNAGASAQTQTTITPTSQNVQQPQPQHSQASPGVSMGTPVGYEPKVAASRERINQVQNEASSVPQQNAIFSQIEDLSKSGAPSGDIEAKIYKVLSEKGLINPSSDVEKQREEMAKYMENAALAGGMPTSDARLDSLHHANVNPEQLPSAIQALVPFFKASNEGKLLKQEYYNRTLNGSLNPDQEVAAKQQWDNNYDPRIIEFKSLPDGAAKKAYLAGHPDFKNLIPKMKNLQQMGVIQ